MHNPNKMATNAIITAANLDISKVTIGEIRNNQKGGKSVPIKYNGQSLQIRIPKMTYPMGVNIKDGENGTSYTLKANLKGCDPLAKERAPTEAGEIGNLYNFLLDLQAKLLETATTNSTRWFGKARTADVLSALMKQFLSLSVQKVNGEWVPTGQYPPSLIMKVPVYDGKVSMDVSDHTGKSVEITTDNIGSVFKKYVEASIVVTPSIYISGQGFGVTWRISYARVAPPQRLTARDIFADEIDEEIKQEVDEEQHQQNEETTVTKSIEVPVVEETPTAATTTTTKNRRRIVTQPM